MKKIYKFLFIMMMYNSILFAFEIDSFNKNDSLTQNFSINCLQMTQSQQILKAYVMVGLKSNFQNPKENLERAIVDYDKRAYQVRDYFLKRLKAGDKEAKKSFKNALDLWVKNKKMLESTPSKENALKIRTNFLKMIDELLRGTKPLATEDLELISLTGKLCRKPIEISITYLLKIWGTEIPSYKEELDEIMENFHKNLKILSENKLNNKESLELLKKAKREFLFFEYMVHSKRSYIPTLLSKKADDNFLIIRKIKQIYKKESEK